MATADAEIREILQSDLPSFNQALMHANLTPLLAQKPQPLRKLQ